MCNKIIWEYARRRDFRLVLSPVHTPPSNGLIERHNGIIKMIGGRLLEDFRESIMRSELKMAEVLLMASAAKNSSVQRCGFSAQYIAFLQNHHHCC